MPNDAPSSHDTPPTPAPYRDPAQLAAPPPAPRPTPRRSMRWTAALCAVLLAGVLVVRLRKHARPGATTADAPVELFDGARAFPLAEPDLDPAVPLAPLLALEEPDRLAVLEPGEGALNVSRGDSVRVRFNRPMVNGTEVGHDLDVSPLVFGAPVRGVARWTSRSTVTFVPDATMWERTLETSLAVAPTLRSLAGESLADDTPRTVVFDGTPRLLADATTRRVLPGEPLRLVFEGGVDTRALASQFLVYESGGGQRSLGFALAPHGRDAEGRTLVDLQLGRVLEPGTQIAVVATPMVMGESGDQGPQTLNFDLAPRPRIEGVGCPMNATDASGCSYSTAPGRIVDIGEALRVVASVALATPAEGAVRVTPALPGVAVTVHDRLLTVTGEWAPNQVYEVRFNDLADTEHHVLSRTAPLAVRSAGRTPEIRVASGRLTFERDATPELRFAGVHLDTGVARYAAVRPGSEFDVVRALADVAAARRAYTFQDTPLAALAPTARPNRWGRGAFAWRDASAGRGANMALVHFEPVRRPASAESDEAAEYQREPTVALVQATDLGVTVHALDRGRLVWVTSIASAQPVAGADVALSTGPDVPVITARTDDRGIAWLPAPAGAVEQTATLRVVHADDRAVMVLDPRTAVRPNNLALSEGAAAPPPNAPVASILTDRGIYRPGETVRASVVVRTLDGIALHALRRGGVHIRLLSPTEDVPVHDVVAALNAFGVAEAALPVSAGASAGEYTVQVTRERVAQPLATASVRVAEFHEPAFRVDMQVPPGELVSNDTVHARVVAAYPFGAPAAGVRAHWTLSREAADEYPVRWERYTFAGVDAASYSGTVAAGDVALDGEGAVQLAASTANSTARRERDTLEIEVRDASGRTTGARRSFVTYPATYEVGVHTGPAWLEAGASLDVDSVVIAHDGTPVPGRAVAVEIAREGWHSYWEWSSHGRDDAAGTQGGFQPRRARDREIVHACDLTSGTEPMHCVFAPTRPGTYVLEARTVDANGRESLASRRVYVAGPNERPDRDPPGAPIAVTPARRSWFVGERARLVFESPWADAEALVTVQREGLLYSERRHVTGGSQVIEVAVTRDMVPNAFVAVTLVRPRTAPPGREVDLGAPDLRFGAAEIAARAQAAPLAVDIASPAAPVLPGTDVTVDVTVRDASGRPVRANVALYAVDEGTLRLTGYAAPDPTADLIPRRGPSFAFEDLRRTLVARVELPALPEASGDGSDGRPASRDDRERFDPTPLWQPRLLTDAAGRVHATFRVPDRPAQYRVMAVAVDTGDSSGRASTALTATRPVVLRSALPHALTTGDRFDATLFVHNTTTSDVDATVACTIAGAARPARQLHLAPGADVRLSETAEAPDADTLDVRCTATAAGVADAFATRVSVRPRGRWSRSQTVGAVRGARDVGVRFADGTLARGGRVTLAVATHPFVGFESAVGALEDRAEYGAEPIASALLGLASYARLESVASRANATDLRARGVAAIERLLALQTPSGGFGYWTSDDAPDNYGSAWAARALNAARSVGWPVPRAAHDRAIAYVTRMIAAEYGDGPTLDEVATGLRVLADAGHPEAARADSVYAQREQLSPFGLAQLALALGPRDRRRDALLAAAVRHVLAPRADAPRDATTPVLWYDTSTRTTAAVLEAAAAIDSGLSPARRLASRLLRTRVADDGATWGTGHETTYALAALAAYAGRFREAGALEASVRVDGALVRPTSRTRDAAFYVLPFASLARGDHAVHIDARGTAFYALGGRWATALGPADDIARGRSVALHRVLETDAGTPIAPGARVHLGDLVRVRLFMFSEDEPPPFVAIRDAVGGGFEAVDNGLETTARASLEALLGMGPDDDAVDPRGFHAMRSLDLVSQRGFSDDATVLHLNAGRRGLQEFTYAIRATTVGTFVLPPAELEGMYTHRYAARSTAATLTVDP